MCTSVNLYFSTCVPWYSCISVLIYLSIFVTQFICISANFYLGRSVPQYIYTSVHLYLSTNVLPHFCTSSLSTSVLHTMNSCTYLSTTEQVPGPGQGPGLAVRPHDDGRLGVVRRVARVGGAVGRVASAPPQGLDPPGGPGGAVAGLHLAPALLGVVVASGHSPSSHYCSQSG